MGDQKRNREKCRSKSDGADAAIISMTVRYYLLVFIVFVALLSMGSYMMTRAFFTDTVVSANNTFTTAESFGEEVQPTIDIDEILITEVYSHSDNSLEWVEIYNDSGGNINMKDWKIADGNSTDTISAEINFGSEKHALIVPMGSSVVVPEGVEKIEIDTDIGSGLNISGDKLILTDNKGNTIQTVSWGSDKTYTDLPNPSVPQSLQRNPVPTSMKKYLNSWKLGTPSAGLRNN